LRDTLRLEEEKGREREKEREREREREELPEYLAYSCTLHARVRKG